MSRSERIVGLLGMSYGAACNRLRKNILFHLLKEHGKNICFKCSEVIDKVEDLSIEHKLPWEGRDASLFWDIENIAFSHMKCNRPHTPPSTKKYFTPEDKLAARRMWNATWMKKNYTTEKRQLRKQETGY